MGWEYLAVEKAQGLQRRGFGADSSGEKPEHYPKRGVWWMQQWEKSDCKEGLSSVHSSG